jgi:hypothetical protein
MGISAEDRVLTRTGSRISLKARHKWVDAVEMTLCVVIADADDWLEMVASAKKK